MKKNNRVLGLIGIGSYMSNFNADFTGYPKNIGGGNIFASDKALKFPMKKLWQIKSNNTDVLYIRTYKEEKGAVQPKLLAERYEEVVGKKVNGEKAINVLSELLKLTDVLNFGATFAEKPNNISITGAVQINQGFNKYKNTKVVDQAILSPFKNSNDKSVDATATSIGSKIVTDEAHYVYSFTVNPSNYNDYIGIVDDFEGYTEEAYQQFKTAALCASTAFNTNSKSGCENEFAIFVELNNDSNFYLANLDQYVKVSKSNDKVVYDLTALADVLNNNKADIKNIELHYNKYKLEVMYGDLQCNVFNII